MLGNPAREQIFAPLVLAIVGTSRALQQTQEIPDWNMVVHVGEQVSPLWFVLVFPILVCSPVCMPLCLCFIHAHI